MIIDITEWIFWFFCGVIVAISTVMIVMFFVGESQLVEAPMEEVIIVCDGGDCAASITINSGCDDNKLFLHEDIEIKGNIIHGRADCDETEYMCYGTLQEIDECINEHKE